MAFAGDNSLYPKQRNWESTNTGRENISLFVFRDVNGDGVYSAGEPPIANVAVIVHRPDASRLVRRSNLNGFANVTNSVAIPGVDISEEAEYRFEVIPPPGWGVTTGNASQLASFHEAPQARPGIVADRVPLPIGLAPEPTISGRISSRSSDGKLAPFDGVDLKFEGSESARTYDVVTDESGAFTVRVDRGNWRVYAMASGPAPSFVRTVVVRQAPVYLAGMVLGDEQPADLPREVAIDFDSLTDLPLTKMPSYPDGLHWTNLIVSRSTTYLGAGYINNTVTGSYIGYNSSGYPVTVSSESPFDFRGAYFGVAWPEATGETLTVKAWRDLDLVYEESLSLSAMGPVWLDAEFRRVTRVEFATEHYWQFVMDAPLFRLSE